MTLEARSIGKSGTRPTAHYCRRDTRLPQISCISVFCKEVVGKSECSRMDGFPAFPHAEAGECMAMCVDVDSNPESFHLKEVRK
jgi:hypothetical protein